MKKMHKWVIVLIVAIIIGLFIIIGLLDMMFTTNVNNFLNEVFNPVNKNCQIDSDCVIKHTRCGRCICPTEAVNKNWKRICPFPYLERYACEMCPSHENWEVKCINNLCEVIK